MRTRQNQIITTWTQEEWAEFNKKNNLPFGESYAEGNGNVIVSEHVSIAQNGNTVMAVGVNNEEIADHIIRPNLLRAFGSYIVVDLDGKHLNTCREKLEQEGYKIKVLDLSTLTSHKHYNPLKYVYEDVNVMGIVNCIMINANREIGQIQDSSWNDAAASLLNAIILYILHFCPESEHTMAKARELAVLANTDLEAFDELFEKVREINGNDFALAFYDSARKLALGKSFHAVCTSLPVYLMAFAGKEKDDLSNSDSVDIETVCDSKTAVFLTGLETRTRSILLPLFIYQVFNTVAHHITTECENHCAANPLMLVLDDFNDIGRIPNLSFLLATHRHYGISTIIATRTIAQLRNLYKNEANSIIDSCRVITYIPEAFDSGILKLTHLDLEDVHSIPDDSYVIYILGMPVLADKKYGLGTSPASTN